MTAITEETPMTTPISVRIERSLFAQRDWSATLNASLSSMSIVNPNEGGVSSLATPNAGAAVFVTGGRRRAQLPPEPLLDGSTKCSRILFRGGAQGPRRELPVAVSRTFLQ